MLFSSMTFLWVFLPIVFIIYRIVKGDIARNMILLTASIIFYAWGSTFTDILVFIGAVVFNYAFALLISGKVGSTRKALFITALAVNLGTLCLFKYSSMAARFHIIPGTLAGTLSKLAMPIGISFFTFLNLAYIIDVYRKDIEAEKSFADFMLHIAFFPKLISGPIVSNAPFLSQIKSRSISSERTAYGIKRFIYGLGKKVIISNQLATVADGLFDMDISYAPTGYLWTAAIFYTFQLYFDSSGYADMAIGLGQMFGFDLPENFNFPYIARSITDFWKRWHISLTSWFRKYVYFPLGGSRKGSIRTLINIAIIFFLTGIWHGSGICFIAWGLWHGLFMIIERALKNSRLSSLKIPVFIKHIYTMLVVVIGWVFFRAGSFTRAVAMIKAMFVYQKGNALPIQMFVSGGSIAVLVFAVLFCGPVQHIFPRFKQSLESRTETGWIQVTVLAAIMLLSITFIVSGTYNAFIYFRF